MATISSKYGTGQYPRKLDPIVFSGMQDGVMLTPEAEQIPITALQKADNWEMDSLTGSIRTALGLQLVFDAAVSVDRACSFGGQTIFSSGSALYRVDLTAATPSKTATGTLSGAKYPTFCQWDADLFMASGNKVNKLTTAWVYSTITASKTSDFLFVDEARLWTCAAGQDFVEGSALGDPTTWGTPVLGTAFTNQSDPVWYEAGYKDGADIVSVHKFSKDIIFFKRGENMNIAHRKTGYYPDYTIYPVGTGVFADASLEAYNQS